MMSLYNISDGSNLAETKISDFFACDLLEGREEPEESLEMEDSDTANVETDFIGFFAYKELDSYSRDIEDSSIIKEEISLTPFFQEQQEAYNFPSEYENALSFERLPKFRLEEEEIETEEEEEEEAVELPDVDLSGIDDLTEEEKEKIERAGQIAEIREILDEWLDVKKQEALSVLQTAKEEADLIKKTAEHAAEKIKEDAYNEAKTKGYSDGYENGMADSEKTINSSIEKEVIRLEEEVSKIISSVTETKDAIVESFIDDLRNLALSTAEKIVKVSLESSGEVIKGMILSAVEDLQKTEWLKIYISRYDFELLKETDYDLLDALSSVSEEVKIVIMEEEEIGTAIVETPQQVIDLSVNSQLNNIKEIVDNAL